MIVDDGSDAATRDVLDTLLGSDGERDLFRAFALCMADNAASARPIFDDASLVSDLHDHFQELGAASRDLPPA